MKYSSRKFYKTTEKDEILLYFMSILTLVQIFYLVMHKKYKLIALFFIFVFVLSFFIKNQSIVLILSIITINILLNAKNYEGLETKIAPKTASLPTTQPTEPTEPTKHSTKKSSKGVSKNASSISAPTTLNPKENFDGATIGKKDGSSGQIDQVGHHIEALTTLMDKFSDLTKKYNLFGK